LADLTYKFLRCVPISFCLIHLVMFFQT
jgi:hypothetical protein